MPSKSKITTDHEEIRRWAEERGGKPARVKRTGGGDDPGILRIDFPGYSGADSLEEISWDEFFDKFDENGLALLYQERTAGGQRSNFNKLISRETAQASGGRGRSRGRARTEARGRRASGSRRAGTSARGRVAGRRSSRSQSRTKSQSRSEGGRSRSTGSGSRSQSKSRSARSGGSSRRAGGQSKSARGVSSKKTSRGRNQGRRAA